jgi:hypothetical protein
MFRAASAIALLIAGGAVDRPRAESKLEALYTISMAHITVGKGSWAANIADEGYTITASGSAAGILSVLISGDGSLTAHGSLKEGRLLPESFKSTLNIDDEKTELRMRFENGNVTELVAEAVASTEGRVPVIEAHRHGIIDPLSALLVPVAGSGELLTSEACQRSLPIFDGRRRYDLKLTFKQMEKVKADKGYQGPVVVCSLTFQAIAGHRANSALVKYLSQGRDMELWLAPIAGTRVLAPFHLSITNLIGNIVIHASKFEALAQASQRSSITPTARAP